MTDAEKIAELATENRRLRLILDTLTRAGVGKGAVVEIYQDKDFFGVAVCRADCDEVKFTRDVMRSIEMLAAALGTRMTGEMKRTGVTTEGDDGNG